MCQSFLKQVLAGASLGRAALQARLDYIQAHAVLDPVDLKTLAQYSLLADPSIHCVQVPHELGTTQKGMSPLSMGRDLRREQLLRFGTAIGAAAAVVKGAKALVAGRARALLTKAVADAYATYKAIVTDPSGVSVKAGIMVIVAAVVIANIIVDLTYLLLDPRIRHA